MYQIFNRCFNSYSAAENYCLGCDFDPALIEYVAEAEAEQQTIPKTENTLSYEAKKELYNSIQETAKQVKGFNISTYKKIEHKTKLIEVKRLLEKCYDNIQCSLLLPECNYHFKDYKTSVEIEEPKKILDHKLKRVIKETLKELNNIIKTNNL